jgi:hypothetical protein
MRAPASELAASATDTEPPTEAVIAEEVATPLAASTGA